MKIVYLLIIMSVFFFSCESADVADVSEDSQDFIETIPTEETIVEDVIENIVDETLTNESLEEEAVLSVTETAVIDDVESNDDSVFLLDDSEPMLVEENEVVLSEAYDEVIEDEVLLAQINNQPDQDKLIESIEEESTVEIEGSENDVLEDEQILANISEIGTENIGVTDSALETTSDILVEPAFIEDSTSLGIIDGDETLAIEQAQDVVQGSESILNEDQILEQDTVEDSDIGQTLINNDTTPLTAEQDSPSVLDLEQEADSVFNEQATVTASEESVTPEETLVTANDSAALIDDILETVVPATVVLDQSIIVPATAAEEQGSEIDQEASSMQDVVIDSTGNIVDTTTLDENTDPSKISLSSENVSENTEIPLITDPMETIPLVALEEAMDTSIKPSQHLDLLVGDYIDIFLDGQGWIYLGEVEEASPPILTFYARYIDGDDTLFNFYAENTGETLLHFYKQDIIGNLYLDEYVSITINEQAVIESAPVRSPTIAEEMFGISAEPEVSLIGGQNETLLLGETSLEYEFVPEDLLEEAQIAYDEGRYEDSISLLDEYTSLGVSEIDRALFLYGQNYETTSSMRNIRLAIASYDKILTSFPDSAYWSEAEKRVIYLERFYVNIR